LLNSSTTISGNITFPANVTVTSGTTTGTLGASGTGSTASGVVNSTSTAATGVAVRGAATSATGVNYGLYGISSSNAGRGVYGQSTGAGYGVQGYNNGGLGTGVLGLADNASGPTYGVQGQSTTSGGYGVYGLAASGTGTNYGVRGDVFSASGFGVFSGGNFGGTGAKYFIQPHPTDPAREVRFVCLEGNEAGTYFRGSGKLEGGVALIPVPEDFRAASSADGLTIQLTPIGAAAALWIETKSLEGIAVRGSDDVAFDFLVNGVRRGFGNVKTLTTNEHWRPVWRGVPFGTQYPDELRQILVENGTLNPDYTPNEATAAQLGWELRDPNEMPVLRALDGLEIRVEGFQLTPLGSEQR
jgi:hypothetical protein